MPDKGGRERPDRTTSSGRFSRSSVLILLEYPRVECLARQEQIDDCVEVRRSNGFYDVNGGGAIRGFLHVHCICAVFSDRGSVLFLAVRPEGVEGEVSHGGFERTSGWGQPDSLLGSDNPTKSPPADHSLDVGAKSSRREHADTRSGRCATGSAGTYGFRPTAASYLLGEPRTARPTLLIDAPELNVLNETYVFRKSRPDDNHSLKPLHHTSLSHFFVTGRNNDVKYVQAHTSLSFQQHDGSGEGNGGVAQVLKRLHCCETQLPPTSSAETFAGAWPARDVRHSCADRQASLGLKSTNTASPTLRARHFAAGRSRESSSYRLTCPVTGLDSRTYHALELNAAQLCSAIAIAVCRHFLGTGFALLPLSNGKNIFLVRLVRRSRLELHLCGAQCGRTGELILSDERVGRRTRTPHRYVATFRRDRFVPRFRPVELTEWPVLACGPGLRFVSSAELDFRPKSVPCIRRLHWTPQRVASPGSGLLAETPPLPIYPNYVLKQDYAPTLLGGRLCVRLLRTDRSLDSMSCSECYITPYA
ncbi:hypothetical protein BIW11_00103 [Tropilaelaps mercedesae]|uniref:Uncharacterized protein n=1 Tax=Tropilaelaps mercedesae TaxID=418985 RepID=A0A1V9Y284_9ACAR|nr:hypothetical protein BIW11_00103 [Tropilaelaps mercedesae]